MRIIYIVVCCILLYSIYNLGYMHGYRSGISDYDKEIRRIMQQRKNQRIGSIVITHNVDNSRSVYSITKMYKEGY